ncbi:unnamed protein product [[Candida] boidinii]|uniref:Unnamed protein product n=1 Tax=Candida boidinii TaxID=5477 RepID=A0A9W6SX16_CANBO|nr:hypothetical protein B5S33_g5047 [[Candida] boidinii]GME67763.1 unnamed protein product [[Candida] boidinii]
MATEMSDQVINLLYAQISADNNLRMKSELEFNELVKNDPSNFVYELISICLNNSNDKLIRQAILLHLKRLVPQFWSIGFESFVGPHTVNQDVKQFIRSSLLQLISDPDSMIRNGVNYAIVQIAAVDYPDEWPSLLTDIYSTATSDQSSDFAKLGSLALLNDLFDDLITEEQLFENNVALNVISSCSLLLSKNDNISIKISIFKLLISLINSLSNSDISSSNARIAFINNAIGELVNICFTNLKNLMNEDFINYLSMVSLKGTIYDCINELYSSFNQFFESNTVLTNDLWNFVLSDLKLLTQPYSLLISKESDELNHFFKDTEEFIQQNIGQNDPSFIIIDFISNRISSFTNLSSVVQVKKLNENNLKLLYDELIQYSCLTKNIQSNFTDDYNEFVSFETGLDVEINLRESIFEFINDLDEDDVNLMTYYYSIQAEEQQQQQQQQQQRRLENWKLLESIGFLLYCCFSSEQSSSIDQNSLNLDSFFQFIVNSINSNIESLLNSQNELKQDNNTDDDTKNELISSKQLLISRLIIIIPKFLDKFQDLLPTYKEIAINTLNNILINSLELSRGFEINKSDYDADNNLGIIKSSILISFTYYNYFTRAKSFTKEIQCNLLLIISSLNSSSQEDTDMLILEALSIIICIDNQFATNANADIVKLIYSIAFKDPSNISTNQLARECLQDLLRDIPLNNYYIQCEFGIKAVVEIIDNSLSKSNNGISYTPELDLSLDFLNVFLLGPNQKDPLDEDDDDEDEEDDEEKDGHSHAGHNHDHDHDDDHSACDHGHKKDSKTPFVINVDLFNYIFPKISTLILLTDDDQLLQSASESFTELLNNATEFIANFKDESSNQTGNDILLKIVSKFLSPDVPDTALLNFGDLINSMIKNFQNQALIQQYLPDILKAVTVRLIKAKHMLTIESLILVFNELTILSPSSTIEFLQDFTIDEAELHHQKTALSIVLPIWISAFEVMRGYAKILKNIKAFIEIFKLNDERVNRLLVEGDAIPIQNENPDIIITRSMAKKIPIQYEKIPASLKIIKLLIHELQFQCQQPDAKSILEKTMDLNKVANAASASGNNGDDDDDGWEDLDDIGVPSFEKLQDYVTDSKTGEEIESDGDRHLPKEESILLLKNFFKECAINNIGNFKEIYNNLKDEEKKVLTSHVIFSE